MSDAYERVKGGRLIFKGGVLGTRSKDIDKKKKKKKKNTDDAAAFSEDHENGAPPASDSDPRSAAGEIYTIDAAKKMKYEDLFPVEAKKFGYDPNAKSKSVEEALDDRIKKKADRYCK